MDRNNLHQIEQWLSAIITLAPYIPLMKKAIDAEMETPGYGAEAIMFRTVTEILKALEHG